MRIVVDIPDQVGWRLAGIAEQHDQRISDWLTDMAIAHSRTPQPTESDPVVRMWRSGATDKQIAQAFDMTNHAVATRRRKFNLPANRANTKAGNE